MKKRLLFSLLLCFLFTLLASSGPAWASTVTDTISIAIGYFGWEEEDYVEKCSFHWQELDDLYGGALQSHEMVYSYYSGSRTYLVAARGFYIRDLLEYAGVDFGSIARIDFFTKDQTVGAYRTFTKSSLFDMPRYYYPNMAADGTAGGLYPYDGGRIDDGAVQVESMLALEDYTEWDSVGSVFEKVYDRTLFSAASRFHLFFGQLDPGEANTSSAAKYVYRLLITFSGTPVLHAEETNIDLKVGSDFRTSLSVSAEDGLLDDYVIGQLVWTSQDEGVVSVDAFGNLSAMGEGETVVSATFGESSVSLTVRVGDKAGDGLAALPGPDGDSAQEDTQVRVGGQTGGAYALSSALTDRQDYEEWVRSILYSRLDAHDGEGALLNARREAMADDARQLVLLAKPEQSRMGFVSLVLTACFVSGFGYGVLISRRRTQA